MFKIKKNIGIADGNTDDKRLTLLFRFQIHERPPSRPLIIIAWDYPINFAYFTYRPDDPAKI